MDLKGGPAESEGLLSFICSLGVEKASLEGPAHRVSYRVENVEVRKKDEMMEEK